jgi:drug/metabolite transporter (DMT)-like permease
MSPRAWTAFAAISTLWGIPYLFIRIAVDDGVPPAFLAWSRVLIGAAVLLALAWRAGVLSPLRGRARWLIGYAVLEIAIPFPLIATGEKHVSSSLAAIIIACVPLIVALLALRFDHDERATGRRLVGLLIGLVGVIALVGIDIAGNSDELFGAACIFLAAVGYAAAPMMLKRQLADLDPRATMGVALAIAAVVLTVPAALDPPSVPLTTEAVLSIVVLGLLCTAAALAIMAWLVVDIGPGRALVITYINPIVAVALGVTILGERPGAGAVAGLLLILAGSWLSTDGRLPPGLVAFFDRVRGTPRAQPEAATGEVDARTAAAYAFATAVATTRRGR